MRPLLAIALLCGGCSMATRDQRPVTFRDAMEGTVDALNAAYARAREPGNHLMGYYPCNVTATFGISSTIDTSAKIGMSASGTPAQGITITGTGSAGTEQTTGRSSSVTVTFVSALCAPKDAGTPGASNGTNNREKLSPERPDNGPQPVMLHR